MTNNQPSLRERKRLNTQQKLYNTATQLIAQRGYENVTVDDICASAEVARATFFRYFGTKAGLMLEFDRRIVATIEDALASKKLSPTEQLSVVQSAMATAWNDVHPNMRALGVDYLKSTAVSDMGRAVAEIHKVTTRIVQAGQSMGEFKASLPAATVAAIFISSIRVGIYNAARRESRADISESTHPIVDLLLKGLVSGETAHKT